MNRSEVEGDPHRLIEGMAIALEPETQVELDGETILLKVEDNYVVESSGQSRRLRVKGLWDGRRHGAGDRRTQG